MSAICVFRGGRGLYMDIMERNISVSQHEKFKEIVYDCMLWEAAHLEWMKHRQEIRGGGVDKGS